MYFESVVDDVQEALKEFSAPMPSQKRINWNIGIRTAAAVTAALTLAGCTPYF